jgi:proteasome accessory factor A
LTAVETGDLASVGREIDWVAKYQMIERYRAKHDVSLGSARVAQLDLAYHDIHRPSGLYYLLERKGAVTRVVDDLRVFEAKSVPPQTTICGYGHGLRVSISCVFR